MATKTNFNVSPYFDDYNEEKDFYKILFRPSVDVQTRELNQLQTILQRQIEKFGDNIFQRGTILSGCNFKFHRGYPYAKLSDNTTTGELTTPSDYVGLFAEDKVTGLKAFIVNYSDGYEASDPDLKTIYFNYINSGTNNTTAAFTPGNNIVIGAGNHRIEKVTIDNGSTGFSNTDTVVVVPAMLVNVISGSFTPGDTVYEPASGANAVIVSIDANTAPGKNILRIKPQNNQLTNSSINSTAWTFTKYESIRDGASAVDAVIEGFYGNSATANLTTSGTGKVTNVHIITKGSGYSSLPYVTIKTSNSSAGISSLDLTPQTYIHRVQIPNVSNAVGNGYAFSVSNGIIYDLGLALRVANQTVIVSKYTESPNAIAVGFTTPEEIVDEFDDTSLLDNALGFENESAPGAHRLKLSPTLTILSKEDASANEEFFTLVEWNNGQPYKQNRVTQYSKIGDAIARTAWDQTGNYVMDAFNVTTETPEQTNLSSTYYTCVVDPGQAYINGRKVQTLSNYKIDVRKGLDTKTSNNNISLNYGNYIRINEVGGSFDVDAGDQVTFYSLPTKFCSNNSQWSSGSINTFGDSIGTARIRSVELENGKPGEPATVYRLFLFDIQMNAGRNFRDIRAVHFDDGTYEGIGDAVTEFNATLSSNVAILKETGQNSLLFYSGVESLKNSNNSNYIYNTTSLVNTAITSGTIAISTAGSEYFPYGNSATLSSSQMRELKVVPVEADLIANGSLTGNVSVSTAAATVNGSGTSFFSDFEVGDYIHVTSGGSTNIRRVTAVNSVTSIEVDSAFTFSNTTSTFRRAFPQYVPVPFGSRTGLTANVDLTAQNLTLQFGHSNGTAMVMNYGNTGLETKVSYDVQRQNVESSLKTAVRGKYVKLSLANNVGGTTGPWCIGVPDAFRLRSVTIGSSSSVDQNSADVTKDFYLDHNQNANYMNLGYLYKNPSSGIQLSSSDYLLVCFDYFTRDTAGYYDAKSYRRTADAAAIATIDGKTFTEISANSAAHSYEIPELIGVDNTYYDLLNQFDFRPAVDATATPAANAASAPLNPTETKTFSSVAKIPKPNSIMSTQVEQYLGRVDDVYIGESGNIYILKGMPDIDPRRRLQSNHPKDSLRLQILTVPPYPNYTENSKTNERMIGQTRIANEKGANQRYITRVVKPILTTTNLQIAQPMVYTMEDIGNIDRRLKDVEYYVTLSLLETNITNKVIPSSVDSSLNRFKYGFFADDFSTEMYSDTDNPQYAASIESEGDIEWGRSGNPLDPNISQADQSNPTSTTIPQPTKLIQSATNRAVPPKYTWSMAHIPENAWYIDEPIIEQNYATESNDPCVIDATGTTTGFAYYIGVDRLASKIYSEGLSGTTTLYFQSYGNTGSVIDVFAPNGAIVATTNATANTVAALSNSDLVFITTDDLAEDYYEAISSVGYDTAFSRNGSLPDYGTGTGKLTFSMTSSGAYTIKSRWGGATDTTKFLIEYPSLSQVDAVVQNSPECDPNPPVYRGTMNAGAFTMAQWSCSNLFRVNSSNYRAFVLEATGLKPNTEHTLYMDSAPWLSAINITASGIKAAQYEPRRKNPLRRVRANSTELNASSYHKVNELTRYLQQSRKRLYDSAGNPSAATVLTTNKFGNMRILVFFPLDIAGWFSQDFNADAYAEQIISSAFNKNLRNAYNYRLFTNKLKPTYGSSGYTTLEISDGRSSSAIRVFANRTPNKVIPSDSRGNI